MGLAWPAGRSPGQRRSSPAWGTNGHWLLASQDLQRLLLLYATTQGFSAAFHTQPLELPQIRRQIRAEFTDGADRRGAATEGRRCW